MHYPFPHERLDAWHRAREARRLAYAFTRSLPPGFADEARQINNAAASVVRNICEGAGRFRPAEKVLKFEIASGEASEAAGGFHLETPAPPRSVGRDSSPAKLGFESASVALRRRIQSLLDLEVGDQALAAAFLAMSARTAAILTGLIRRHRR